MDARENYFKNAMRLFSEATPDAIYSDAALELGHIYLGQRKFNESIDSFERVINAHTLCREKAKAESKASQCNDESFAEASFYIGLIQWQQGNFESALGDASAVSGGPEADERVQRVGRDRGCRHRVRKRKIRQKPRRCLNEGIGLLKKASESAPDDALIRFNYASDAIS